MMVARLKLCKTIYLVDFRSAKRRRKDIPVYSFKYKTIFLYYKERINVLAQYSATVAPSNLLDIFLQLAI